MDLLRACYFAAFPEHTNLVFSLQSRDVGPILSRMNFVVDFKRVFGCGPDALTCHLKVLIEHRHFSNAVLRIAADCIMYELLGHCITCGVDHYDIDPLSRLQVLNNFCMFFSDCVVDCSHSPRVVAHFLLPAVSVVQN